MNFLKTRRFRRQSLPDEHCPQSPKGSVWTAQTCPRYPCSPFLPGCCPVAHFGKASPYLRLNAGWVLCRTYLLPWKGLGDKSDPTAGGRHGVSRIHRVRPALHPVAAISLSVALWKESAVVPTPSMPQPRTGALEWTSLRRDPGAWLTCKTLCSLGGAMAKSLERAIRRLPADY